jgi:hypothetical protein
MDGHRIAKVRIEKLPESAPASAETGLRRKEA